MQTVLVTGAGGFIGTYLLRSLAPFYKVIAIARSPFAPNPDGALIFYEQVDFCDATAVLLLFEQYKPDVVIHAGALSKPDECEINKEAAYNTNVAGTIHLLNAATHFKSFFLFISTDFVFDGLQGFYKETDPTGMPVNYYGCTKLMAEEAVKKYLFNWCIVRTVLVYGKPLGGRHNLLTVVKEKLEKGETYTVFTDQLRTPTYVEDLVVAIKTIVDLKKEGLYHISGEDALTPFEMAVLVAQYFALDETFLKKADRQSFAQPALRPLKTGFDIAKAKTELQYKPIPFLEGLRKTFY